MMKSLFCAILVAILFVPAAFAETAAAEFKKVHGVVDVFRSGKKAVVVGVGATVAVGDTVRTGRRSRAQLLLADGSVLNIGSLTKIHIGEFSFDAERKIRKSSISDLRGMVRAVVSKSTNKDSFFQIKTPGAVAAVRGTDYGVSVNSPFNATFVTYSGLVAVSNSRAAKGTKPVLVGKGQYTRVISDQAPTPPTQAPAKVMNKMSSGTQPVDNSSSSGTGTGTASGTAAAAPVADTTAATSGTTTQATTVPQTAAPTGQQGTVVAPTIATPPITLSVPGVQNQNVNIVIQF